ncbi:MAG: hypothetical protein QM701_18450 [Propionivibrio sp.]
MQPLALPGRHRTDPEHAAHAIAEAQHDVRVVVGLPARRQRRQIGGHAGDLQPGHKAQQMMRVHAEIGQHGRFADHRGVRPPYHAADALAFGQADAVGAAVFGLHQADLAQLAGAHALPRLTHHREAAVVVGQHEHARLRRDEAGEFARFPEIPGQRLVADDVDAVFQEHPAGRHVQAIRRHHGDHLDAVGAPRLPLGHFGEGGVDALAADAVGAAGGLVAAAVRGKGAGHEVELAVEQRRMPVHRADAGIRAATDESQAQAAVGLERCVHGEPFRSFN